MGLQIEQLGLVPSVEAKARELQAKAPSVIFLSGRRTLEQQAHAMASNAALDRQYVGRTYAHSPIALRLQRWMNQNPHATDIEHIAAGFLFVMKQCPVSELHHLSRHLTGKAFDIAPHSAPVAVIEALEPELFLQHEGALVRWHINW